MSFQRRSGYLEVNNFYRASLIETRVGVDALDLVWLAQRPLYALDPDRYLFIILNQMGKIRCKRGTGETWLITMANYQCTGRGK